MAGNIALFQMILLKTFSWKFIHFIFITLEYIFLFFPSTINITRKCMFIFSETSSKTNVKRGHFLIDSLNSQKTSLSSFLPLLILIIGIVLLLIYLSLLIFYNPNYNKRNQSRLFNTLQIIIVNIFEFILFRYCSFIFIDNLVFLIVMSMQIGKIEFNALAVVYFIVMYVYLVTTIHYLRTYNLLYYIKNTQIIHQFPAYPFNSTMIEGRLYLLFIKVLIAIENNFSFKANSYEHLAPSINLITFILITILSVKVLVANTLLNYKEAYHDTNAELNLFCYFLIIVNISFIITVILFSDIVLPLQPNEIAFYVIGNCIIGFIGTFFLYWHMRKIVFDGRLNLNKILLLIIQNDAIDAPYSIYYYRIYNKISISHFLNCNKKCSFCLNHNYNSLHRNYKIIKPFNIQPHQLNTQVKLLFKHYKHMKANNQLSRTPSLDFDKSDMMIYHYVNFLLYRMKRKMFKFSYYYYQFKHDYSRDNQVFINNIELMIECFFRDDPVTLGETVFFDEILSLSNINKTIHTSLISLKDYAISNTSEYFPEKLLGISDKFSSIRYALLNALLKAEVKDDTIYHNNSMKVMRNIYEYSLIVLRYVIETLFNESYQVLSELKLDLLEDYFNNHYSNDKALIMSVISSTIRQTPKLKILKFTGVLVNNNHSTFSEYFPKIVAKEGEQLMSEVLFSYISKDLNIKSKKGIYSVMNYQDDNGNNSNKNNPGTFQFIIQNDEYMSYFKYSFQISTDLMTSKNNMLLFGFYSIDYENIVLLDTTNKNITLLGFSKEMRKVFIMKSRWLDYLFKFQLSLKLNKLFKSIKVTRSDFIEQKLNKEYIIEEYDCVLQYSKYSKELVSHLEYLLTIDEIKNNEESHLISKSIKKLLAKKEIERVFKLKKLFSISETKGVYCYISSDRDTQNENSHASVKVNKRCSLPNTWMDNNAVNLSTSSIHERPMITGAKHSLEDYKIKKQKDKENCKAERRKMYKYSVSTLIFSFVILIASFVFVIIQSYSVADMKAVSDIFNQYETSKLSFISIFNSFTSSLCIAKDLNDATCVNELTYYTTMLQDNYGLPKELLLEEYIGFEIQTKVTFFLDMFTQFKNMIDQLNDPSLIDILVITMNYTLLDLTKVGDIHQRDTQMSFEDGIRLYYNTYSSINKFQYQIVPFYFFTMEQSVFSFDNLNKLNRSLTDLEINIYTALMNFYNYDQSFRNGETVILNKFSQLRRINLNYLITFMAIVFGLNIALFFLSRANIITPFELFRDIIFNIHSKIENEKFKKHFIGKISNLITLALLYQINPNDAIKTIQKSDAEHKKMTKREAISMRNKETDDFTSGNKLLQTDKEYITSKKTKKNDKTANTLYDKKSIKYVNLNMIFFASIFIFIGIVDIVVLFQFNSVVDIFDFNVTNILFSNWYFVIIAYTHLHFILNTTEADLIIAMNEDIEDNELINTYFKTAYDYYEKMNKFHAQDIKRYPLFESYFTYECNAIVKTVNDSFIQAASQLFEKNYTHLSVFICEHFDLLHLRNFEHINWDLFARMRVLFFEGRGLRSYNDLVKYNRSKDMIELYLIMLIFLRPLKKYYTVTVLYPLISNIFNNYINLVVGLLVANSLLEIAFFCVIKWVFIRNLVKIQDDLFLLKKSFD